MAKTVVRSIVPFMDHWFVAELSQYEYYTDFVIYRMAMQSDDGTDFDYQLADAPCTPTPTKNIEKAEWFCRGSIKWDGCISFEFNDDPIMLHFCEASQFGDFAFVMKAIHKKVIEYCESLGHFC